MVNGRQEENDIPTVPTAMTRPKPLRNRQTPPIREQILDLRRLIQCIMKPLPTSKNGTSESSKEAKVTYVHPMLIQFQKDHIKPLSSHEILYRAKAARNMLVNLEHAIQEHKVIHEGDRNNGNCNIYDKELEELNDLTTKALKFAQLQATSTTTPNPVKTSFLKHIYRPDDDMGLENTSATDSVVQSDDDIDAQDSEIETFYDDNGDDDDESVVSQQQNPQKALETTKNQDPASTKSFNQQTPEEIQKEQAEALESELRQMASQLKNTTSTLHTNLKTQNKTLLSQLEQQTSENLNKVSTVASDTADRVKARRGWRRAAATWGLLIGCMITFCVVFMVIRIFPKRKSACIFFCEHNNEYGDKKGNNSNANKKKTNDWNSWFSSDKEQEIRYGGKLKNTNEKKYPGWQQDRDEYWEQESLREKDSQKCERRDDQTNECIYLVLEGSPSFPKDPIALQKSQESRIKRQTEKKNQAAQIQIQEQQEYATWWDKSEDMIEKEKQELEKKRESIRMQQEEIRRQNEWEKAQEENERNAALLQKQKEAEEIERLKIQEQNKEKLEQKYDEKKRRKLDQTTMDERIERKREFDRTKIVERREEDDGQMDMKDDADSKEFDMLTNLISKEMEEPGCMAAAKAEKQRSHEDQEEKPMMESDDDEAQWIKILKQAENDQDSNMGKKEGENSQVCSKDENCAESNDQIKAEKFADVKYDDEIELTDLPEEQIKALYFSQVGLVSELGDLLGQYPQLVNSRDENGWYPIHEAARGGHVDIVRILVDIGIDINERTYFGKGGSALWWALREHGEDHPIVTLLIEFGALNLGPE